MGRQVVQDQQAGFASGVNPISDPAFLRPDQARQMANIRLSSFGAALKRLGTQYTTAAAVSTFDTTNSVYGGIYWPTLDKVYAIGGSTGSSTMSLWETAYGLPVTWSNIGSVLQYRPVIFTDGTYPEVMYLAGDNTRLTQKAAPTYNTITVDGTSVGTNGVGTTISWGHAVGSGSNRVIVVMVGSGSTTPVTSVVWDAAGTPLSFTRLGYVAGTGVSSELWSLAAPPSGVSKTITVTRVGSIGMAGQSISFFGANQTTPFEMSSPRSTSGASGGSVDIQVPSTVRDYVVDALFDTANDTLTKGAGQTLILGQHYGASCRAGAMSSTEMTWTGMTGDWSYIVGSVTPAPTSPDLSITNLASTTPGVKGLVVYNDRLWAWNSFDGPNSLYFSQLSSTSGSTGGDSLGNTSAGGGQIIVRTFGISAIVACAPVGGSLLIFHARGISRLTGFGQDDISVAPQALTADVGMSNATPSGVCVYGNVAYFVSDRGIYSATESSVAPLSTPDKPDPTSALLAAGTVNPSQFELDYNRQYNEVWVSIKDYGVFIYNTILQSWSGPFTGTYADGTRAIFEVVNSANGISHLWRITWRNATGMFVSECDRASTYKDDVTSAGSGGSVVTMTLQLHRLFGGDRVNAKSWRWLNVLAQLTTGATPPVAAFMTQLGGTNSITFSGLTSIEQPYYLSPGGTGPYLDVTITDAGSTGASQYALATVEGNLLGQR